MRSMPERTGCLERKSRPCARASRREAILRRQRIEQLRLCLQRGEYKVSALQIATAMLDEGVGRELNAAQFYAVRDRPPAAIPVRSSYPPRNPFTFPCVQTRDDHPQG